MVTYPDAQTHIAIPNAGPFTMDQLATKRGGSKSTTVVRLERHGAVTRRSPGSLSVPHPAFLLLLEKQKAPYVVRPRTLKRLN